MASVLSPCRLSVQIGRQFVVQVSTCNSTRAALISSPPRLPSFRLLSTSITNHSSTMDSTTAEPVRSKAESSGSRQRDTPVADHPDQVKDIEELEVYQNMSEADQEIADAHHEALQACEKSYIDPETGNFVLSAFAHRKRGKCCGSACRHCPYQHKNVTGDKQGLKTFNGLFYA